MMNELRSAGGIVEPEILAKKSKNVLTHVAMFLIADETNFDAISNDHTRWSDDRGMRATVQAGLGLFICTGADGAARHEVRIVDRDDLALGSQEYKQLTSSAEPVSLALPSGRLRLGPPVATSAECLEVDVAPGVCRNARSGAAVRPEHGWHPQRVAHSPVCPTISNARELSACIVITTQYSPTTPVERVVLPPGH
jgi:hypothetical protein